MQTRFLLFGVGAMMMAACVDYDLNRPDEKEQPAADTGEPVEEDPPLDPPVEPPDEPSSDPPVDPPLEPPDVPARTSSPLSLARSISPLMKSRSSCDVLYIPR